LGRTCQRHEREQLQSRLDSREAPPTATNFLAKTQQCMTRWTTPHDNAMQVIWRLWATGTLVII
ncbi:hypothetical protein PHMEG_00023688, partial [Phytophthora megakarya]